MLIYQSMSVELRMRSKTIRKPVILGWKNRTVMRLVRLFGRMHAGLVTMKFARPIFTTPTQAQELARYRRYRSSATLHVKLDEPRLAEPTLGKQ